MTNVGLRQVGRDARLKARRAVRAQAKEALRERLAQVEERHQLQAARAGRDVCWLEEESEAEPLVTIRIATYCRGPLVAERAIASALRQTYANIEVLVVGDHCDAGTADAVRSVTDPRVRFVNLGHRGQYPADPRRRWMVAGATPMNVGLHLARGAWMAPCDDDDELTDDHVEVLLREARLRRLEMVWSKSLMEVELGSWEVVGSPRLRHGEVTHGSVMYSAALRFIRHSETSWRLNEPADWNMWKRMRRIGVNMGFVEHVTYRHFLEEYKRNP